MRGFHDVTEWVAMGTFLLAIGCTTDDTRFTDEERTLLADYRLPNSPPANPSNKFADDPRAAVLGKMFFFDTRFSGALNAPNDGVTNGSLGSAGATGRVGCVSCHDPAAGGSDHRSRPQATSFGASHVGRNAPSVINAAYSDIAEGGWQFWDGRKDSLWSQALGPPEAGGEHNGTRLAFAHVIFDHYRAQYEEVFGPLPPFDDLNRFPANGKPGDATYDGMAAVDRDAVDRMYSNFGKSIEAYERKLVSANFQPSAFDLELGTGALAMSPSAVRGAKLFVGKAGCNECHRGAAFTDHKFHNIGCPQQGEYALATDTGRSAGIASVKGDAFNRSGSFSDHIDGTHMSALVAGDLDIGAFKTPTLRNVANTAPYMHDGVYTTLWDVVNHYNFGGNTGVFSGTKEITIQPLLLSDRELDDLVEFLRSLDDGPPLADANFPEGLVAAPTLPN
jgi:cytochrome c peroxidase